MLRNLEEEVCATGEKEQEECPMCWAWRVAASYLYQAGCIAIPECQCLCGNWWVLEEKEWINCGNLGGL